MTYTIQLRRDTAANWTSVNPVLHDGELGWERDTDKFKIGDGTTAWNSLEYTVDDDQLLPDATGLPDGKMLVTDGEIWTVADAPASGDPNAMLSAPAHLLYTFNNIEPTDPNEGDRWTNPDEEPDALEDFVQDMIDASLSTFVTNKDARWTPPTTQRWSKEFRDAADLTGAVRVDGTTPTGTAAGLRMVVSQGVDSLNILLDGSASQDAAAEMHGYVWPDTVAVGEALSCHLLDGGPTYNYSFCGLVIADGNTYGTGNQVFFPQWAGWNPQDGLWTNWNTRGAFTDRPDSGFIGSPYRRIKRTATSTWSYEISSDGRVWVPLSTRTLTMTPAYVGFAGGQWGATGKREFVFDHLRLG